MSTTKYLWLYVPVCATVAFAVLGCGRGSRSPDASPAPSTRGADVTIPTGAGSAPTAATTTAPAETAPDVKLTAEEFYKESNKVGGDLISKHPGKLVELTGVVKSARISFGGDPILLLFGGAEGDIVNCDVGDRNPWSKAFPGQTVTLRGMVPKSINDPKPFVWNIESATGPLPPKMTTENFLKEYIANREVMEKKYKGKHIILLGEVAEPKMYEKMLTGFSLRSKEKKPVVVCHVYGLGGQQEEAFVKGVAKPGQKVTVLVEFDGFNNVEISMRGQILDPPY